KVASSLSTGDTGVSGASAIISESDSTVSAGVSTALTTSGADSSVSDFINSTTGVAFCSTSTELSELTGVSFETVSSDPSAVLDFGASSSTGSDFTVEPSFSESVDSVSGVSATTVSFSTTGSSST